MKKVSQHAPHKAKSRQGKTLMPSPLKIGAIKIGTRGSKLATTQSAWVRDRLMAGFGRDIDPLVIISTSGDRILDRRLIEAGGKALFTKEIEEALLRGDIDLAVHSLKDMPAQATPGLSLVATPAREDPRDAFLSPGYTNLADLPKGARLGTASLRRQAQALSQRPDLEIIMTRGNVDTRLKKLHDGYCDALLLAAAGLKRMGLEAHIKSHIDPEQFAPAPGQGALAIQCRTTDQDQDWIKALNCRETQISITAERGALEALEASCRTAVGAYARLDGHNLHLFVEALTEDGQIRWQRRETLIHPTLLTAHALGLKLGHEIKAEAGPLLIQA
jgi:hydroxymethylbilane synthase